MIIMCVWRDIHDTESEHILFLSYFFFFLVKQEMGFSYFANLANENEMKNTIREYNYVLLQAIIYFFIMY